MKVLLVKMSSLGDVVHALPAVTEAVAASGAHFDWLVEEAFADIPRLHPAVDEVIPVALRRWRKEIGRALRSAEWRALRSRLRATQYDLVLDAQGLLKSAAMVALSRGPSAGFDRLSAREPIAARFYRRRYAVGRDAHAVERLRCLFSQALGYTLSEAPPDYGIQIDAPPTQAQDPFILFLHGSSWVTKQWPESFWTAVGDLAGEAGYTVRLPWGNEAEREVAQRIADTLPHATVLPALRLDELAGMLSRAAGAIGVDGGPSHLAVAAGTPTAMVYSATDPTRTGPWGGRVAVCAARYQCAPCFSKRCRLRLSAGDTPPCQQTVEPVAVWRSLVEQIERPRARLQARPG